MSKSRSKKRTSLGTEVYDLLSTTQSEASTEPSATAQAVRAPREKGEERNGVRRPRAGGKCAAVWEAMETRYASTGTVPSSADAKAWALEAGANVSNATQELAVWKRWAGLTKTRAI